MTKVHAKTPLKQHIKAIAESLGFNDLRVCDTDLHQHTPRFLAWLDKNYHGEMHYMQKHGDKRYHPEKLIPGTKSILVVRMDYLPSKNNFLPQQHKSSQGVISCYATGKDYHKLMRKRLQKLALQLQPLLGDYHHRAFVDSGPVLEKTPSTKRRTWMDWQTY